MSQTLVETTCPAFTGEQIESYRRRGFTRMRGLLTPDEVAEFREAVVRVSQNAKLHSGESRIFRQVVNAWLLDDTIKRLTFHPNIGRLATQLTGVPLRLWHDHILIKVPHNQEPTYFHQDQPYWSHVTESTNISCWVALCDVPLERGCMSFIPGSHQRTDLPVQSLADGRSLFSLAPDLEYEERVTLPLRAGDCTFHNGRTAHMANANTSDEPRVAMSVIMMGRDTRFRDKPHPCTEGRGFKPGDVIQGETFPDVG